MTPLIAARRYFWGAYSFSTLGRFVHGMALSWVVWTQTHSPLWLSAIALLSALPSLPLAPVAGSMADRFHRHHILFNYTDNRLCNRESYGVSFFSATPQSVQLSCAGIDFRNCDFY